MPTWTYARVLFFPSSSPSPKDKKVSTKTLLSFECGRSLTNRQNSQVFLWWWTILQSSIKKRFQIYVEVFSKMRKGTIWFNPPQNNSAHFFSKIALVNSRSQIQSTFYCYSACYKDIHNALCIAATIHSSHITFCR